MRSCRECCFGYPKGGILPAALLLILITFVISASNARAVRGETESGFPIIVGGDHNYPPYEYRGIWEKWLGVDEQWGLSLTELLRYLAMVLVPLILVLCASFLWTWSLRRRVAKRTGELRENERLLAAIIDAIPTPIFYKDTQGIYMGCNQAFADFMGLPKDAVVGKSVFDLVSQDRAQNFHENDQTLLKRGGTLIYESELTDQKGVQHHVLIHRAAFPDSHGAVKGIVGAILDMTGRKQMETMLRHERGRFKQILDNFPYGIYIMDRHYGIEYANPVVRRDFGDPWQRKCYEYFHNLSEPCSWCTKERILAGETLQVEEYFSSKNRHYKIFNTPLVNDDGSVSKLSGYHDITTRKLSQNRIEHLNNVLRAIRDVNQLIVREQSHENLIREGCRLLVENRGYTFAIIVLVDTDQRPITWAQAGMGRRVASLAAMLREGTIPPCCVDIQKHKSEGAMLIDEEYPLCSPCPLVEYCAQTVSLAVGMTHDGTLLGFLVIALERGLGVNPEEQALLVDMAQDLAYALRVLEMNTAREQMERKHRSLQDQMLQAQKMEAVGRLAGGVAHDFNNMLGVIIGYTDLAMDMVSQDDPIHDILDEILKAAKRSADVTRQLLAFSRKQAISPQILHINEAVESMFNMLCRMIGEDIELVWLPEVQLRPVKIDLSQLDQILANLCVNSRDAITGQGTITLKTENATLNEDDCREHPGGFPGDFVVLTVTDNGCGMGPETKKRVFDPFFTTKDVNKGTGLGLSTVYGIVEQNNGFIHVHSVIGKGTAFKIFLPSHLEEAGGEAIEKSGQEGLVKGEGGLVNRSETVLLVEDEPAFMEMTCTMLEKMGCNVLSAASPDDALQMVEEHCGKIHLLVTDVIMPHMNGIKLADRVRLLCPRIKTLFMSGHTADVIAQQGVLEGDFRFIQKPFSLNGLACKVRAVLDDEDDEDTE